MTVAHGTEEWGTRGGLGSGGGVGSPTVVEARDISLATLEAISTVGGSTARGIGENVVAIGGGNTTLLHVGVAREASIVVVVGNDHVVGTLGVSTIARVGDRNIRRGHVAVAGHDDGSSALGNVTISHAESAE